MSSSAKIAVILVRLSCKIAKECPLAMLASSSTFNAIKRANDSRMGRAMAAWLSVVFLNDSGRCVGDFYGVRVFYLLKFYILQI